MWPALDTEHLFVRIIPFGEGRMVSIVYGNATKMLLSYAHFGFGHRNSDVAVFGQVSCNTQ